MFIASEMKGMYAAVFLSEMAAGIITVTMPILTGLSMKRLSISGSTKNPAGSRSLQALRNLLHGIITMRYDPNRQA